MKYGREIEGKFRGLRTLFMDYLEFLNHSMEQVLQAMPGILVDHIYISDHGGNVFPKDIANAVFRWGKLPITLEVTSYRIARDLWPSNVHIMLNIMDFIGSPNSSFWMLRDSDQIKFNLPTGEPGQSHVLCIPKACFIRTLPHEFKDDIFVKLP